MDELYPYQREGAKWLATVGRGLLADDMGLGKSAQAIAACDLVNAQSVAVVCPASVRENWCREFKRFGGDKYAKILDVRSYDQVTRGDLSGWRGDVLVLDEAHFTKSRTAKRTKAIFGENCDGKGGLVERAKHVFLLTGTPAPNNHAELWPMLRAVMPATVERAPGKHFAYWPFVQKFCKTRDNGFGIQIIGGKNTDELKRRIGPYVLRRKKEDVLKDLPPLRVDTLPLTGTLALPADLAEQHKQLAKAIEKDGIEGLAKIAPHVAQLRRMTGIAKTGPVVDWVSDWLDAGGGKIVLFAHHRDVISALHDALATVTPLSVVHGGTTDRQTQIDTFQNDPDTRVFIGQIQAAGTGITLTAAADALFVESSWVPAENEQAAMRIHRIGQRQACTVRIATLAGSIDEQIGRAVARKLEDIRKLFD